jgi:hypothetical protein
MLITGGGEEVNRWFDNNVSMEFGRWRKLFVLER